MKRSGLGLRPGPAVLPRRGLTRCWYHRRFELDRDPLSARYCAECGQLHPAEEGDFWAESSLLGLKITYLAVMDGKVYDITGGCRRHIPRPRGGVRASPQ